MGKKKRKYYYQNTMKNNNVNSIIDYNDVTDNSEEIRNNKNHFIFLLTYVTVLIVFLVIFLSFSGGYLKNIAYYTASPKKQPVNRIVGTKYIASNYNPEDEVGKDKTPKGGGNKDNTPEGGGNEDNTPEDEVSNDKTNVIYGNYIYLVNQFPISDEVGKSLEGEFKTNDFQVEFSKSDIGRKIEITLEKMNVTDLDEDWVKVYLTKNGNDLEECYRSTGRIKTFDEYQRFNSSDNEILIYSGTITSQDFANEYADYRLRMWISEDVEVLNTNYESRSFIARVTVRIHD